MRDFFSRIILSSRAWLISKTGAANFPTALRPSSHEMALLFALLGITPSAWAQRDLTDIPTPDPAEELKTFEIADGFEVNLFAADPQIHKPIQINFDPQGRLWVAASEVYPQVAPGQTANDKILILEDADGDGVSDKTTVFADGLLIPTGVAPGDGGAYVANSTELLHFKDTDGDGKADESRIVLSGFGTEDTHHIIHTFRWGPDSLFYFNQSIYIHSHVETPYGVKRLNAGGIWQFRPETLQLDVFSRGWVNAWGHAFDRWGQSFVTDGAGGEGINYAFPGSAYPTAYGVSRILHGLNPGSPKYCGLEMVDGRHLPDDWQGNLITHDFRGHRVCRFTITDDGSGFASRQQPDLIRSTHVAFRPVDVKQGPDGAIYIADWYNPIIQHGEVDFRDPRRDHVHGRIWRVTAKGRPLSPRPQFAGKSANEVLNFLQAPETETRQQAKRILKEMGPEAVLPALANWVANLDRQSPDYTHDLLEALWVYQGHDAPNEALLKQLLASDDFRARAAAIRVIPFWKDRISGLLEPLGQLATDENPRVRLEAARALSTFGTLEAAQYALRASDLPRDQFLDYAIWLTARELAPVWKPAVLAGTFDFEGSLPRLLYAVNAAAAADVVPRLVERLNAGNVPAEQLPTLLETVGSLGNPDALSLVLASAVDPKTSAEQIVIRLRALEQAKRARNAQPSGDLSVLHQFLQRPELAVQQQALSTIAAWKIVALSPQVAELATAAEKPLPVRLKAMQTLAELGQPEGLKVLNSLVKDPQEGVSGAAVSALIGVNPTAAAPIAIQWLANSKDVTQQGAIVRGFATQKGGPEALAAALAGQKLPADVAKIGLREITGAGRQEPALIKALEQAGGIDGQPKVLLPEEMQAFVGEVREAGNATRGEAIFRRADLACFKCHALGGAGGKVGPDLLSLGSSAQVDYLIDSLLQPNKNIKEGYQTIVVVTDEGKVLSGIKLRENEEELLIRDAENREVSIPKISIDEVANGTSLMPAGLVDKLTHGEVIDLVRFLSELGKTEQFSVGTAQIARNWQALQPDNASMTRLIRTSDTELIRNDEGVTWLPAYTKVSGDLPLAEFPVFQTNQRSAEGPRRLALLRTTLEVTTPGKIALQLNSAQGLQVWVDGESVDPHSRLELDLSTGRHVLTFGVNLRTRQMPVRVELLPISGGAQAAWATTP